MATRMQQRRGTAAQWISTNSGDGPILEVGEIGFETDTGKFKIGDGTNPWIDLSYFADVETLGSALDGDYLELTDVGAVSGVAGLDASKNLLVPGASIIVEGATDNTFETTLTVTDPTADRTITFPDSTGTVALTSDIPSLTGYVTETGSQTLTNKTLGSGTALSADLSAGTYKITNLGAPASSTDAATKAYVDAVSEGLHIHPSCDAATSANVDISTELEAGDVIDGVTLAAGNRVLVKSQTTSSQNGIYVVQASGAALRASDFNEPQEVDGGDFVFVTGGTLYDNTGWVQTTTNVVTIGTDPIVFTQFSGAGTYQAGTGLTLAGNTFSINTSTTVDTSTAQTLTNKTISGASNTLSNIGNASLTNSSITINGSTVSLGGSTTIQAGPDEIMVLMGAL
jgi:hypothetical protein